ncbi:MAG: alpha-D-ribose 1-methylphosphonate 5-triphosphate diphosphatase, partial [Pseudomonadota bacterium]
MLAQFWSWEGGMRGPEFAARMARALGDYRAQAIVDMRLQLRVETHMIDDFPVILRLIEETGIEAVVLNDHLPHAAIRAGKRPPRLTGQALKAGRSPEAHHDLIKHLSGRADEVPEALAQFCADLSARGVRIIGSHDDRTTEARDQFRAMGATLAEFPETEEAALAARDAGDPIVLGAPNVVRGGTHDRGINAAKLFREGACSALVSDYHYPALARGAERLGVAGWHAVTRGPAVIMGATDRGGLGPGMRADLVVLTQDRSAVLGTMVAGRWAYLRAPLTERLM